MSSNPLMMGYEGGDLLLTSVVGQRSGSPPRPVCAGCGRWPGWPLECALEAEDCRTTGLTAGLTAYATMRYINRRSLPLPLPLDMLHMHGTCACTCTWCDGLLCVGVCVSVRLHTLILCQSYILSQQLSHPSTHYIMNLAWETASRSLSPMRPTDKLSTATVTYNYMNFIATLSTGHRQLQQLTLTH